MPSFFVNAPATVVRVAAAVLATQALVVAWATNLGVPGKVVDGVIGAAGVIVALAHNAVQQSAQRKPVVPPASGQ